MKFYLLVVLVCFTVGAYSMALEKSSEETDSIENNTEDDIIKRLKRDVCLFRSEFIRCTQGSHDISSPNALPRRGDPNPSTPGFCEINPNSASCTARRGPNTSPPYRENKEVTNILNAWDNSRRNPSG